MICSRAQDPSPPPIYDTNVIPVAANIPTLALVGGFLGAGKTTLILKAMELLRGQGKRLAVILNDQDAGLVDTEHALARKSLAREVPSGCFCCRFSEFIARTAEVAEHRPDIIFAEPVGSCIDVVATVIQPLQANFHEQLSIAPFTVLLDPSLARRLQDDSLDSQIRYLATHQLGEADLICTTKHDLYPDPLELPFPVDLQLSAKTGFGIEAWINEMLHLTRIAGARLLDVDYTRYAEAEAALGWLNLHASVELRFPQSPALVCGPLLDEVEKKLTSAGIFIAHLKIFDRSPEGWVKASICANGAEPVPEGDLLAEPAIRHQFALNLRALADPAQLQQIVSAALEEISGSVEIHHLRAFRPPAPKPEYRVSSAWLSAQGFIAFRS